MPKRKNNNYIWHMPYLRNSIYSMWSWFLVQLYKMMISTGVFFIVLKFWGGGVKGKSIAQNENNNYFCHMPYLRNSIALWSGFLVHLCKMMISPSFFIIFDIFIFWAVRAVKGQKMAQNDKKISLTLYLRNCTSYNIYIYMVFTTEGFLEVAIESWSEWDLNPRPLNSVQTL